MVMLIVRSHWQWCRSSGIKTLALVCMTLCAACVGYEPAPLDTEAILAAETQRRSLDPGEHGLTLACAVEAMRAGNPRIREAWAAAAIVAAVARTPTPLANPNLSLGPVFLRGAEVLGSAAQGAEAAFGWAVPLSGTRALNDDLNQARCEAALLAAAGAEREEYLLLRADMTELSFLNAQLMVHEEVAAGSASAVEVGRQLVQAALATALDLRMFEVQAARSAAVVLAGQSAVFEAQAKLSARTGLALATCKPVAANARGALPPMQPTRAALEGAMLKDNPVLNALRARYVVAEHELKLEVARQFPSLSVTPAFEREQGVDRWGFPLAIDIPLFDRNQQNIAAACAERAAVRTQFQSGVGERFGEIESGCERLRLAQLRFELAQTRIAPLSTSTIDLARRGLRAGAVDAVRFLDVLRADREARLDLLATEFAVFEAWLRLEQVCGIPLLRFHGEPALAAVKEDSP